MVATGNQNKCPPENQHFSLTELKANAMKIEVHHAAAVRNESHSEEDVTINYWSEKLVEIYSQVQLIILNRELKNNEQKSMLYLSTELWNALHSKKNWPKFCMVETRTTSSKFQKFIIKEELELSQGH